jgi:FAD dependent oxidoreductase TIGR03364
MQRTDVAVVGAGIVGLAHALAAARRGLQVSLFERSQRAVGASIRNFGLPWPVGLARTELYGRAMRSREVWLETARQAGFWMQENGSLFLAYHPDEAAVLQEFQEAAPNLACRWLDPSAVEALSPAARLDGLIGGLFSPTELTVDPRQAVRSLPAWLETEYGVQLHFETPVNFVDYPYLEAGSETWQARQIYVCSGADFETLFPQVYRASGLTRCKLQMLRLAAPTAGWRLGPTLASGLTLARYDNFDSSPTVAELRRRLEREWPEQTRWGIHVLLTQNGHGELLTGDTHEYGLTFDPFDSERANELILEYLATFVILPGARITERWHGMYPKLDGSSELVLQPQSGVSIVQVTNGLGMTLAFGLAEEILARL